MQEKGRNSSATIKDIKQLKRIASRLKEKNYKAYILWSIALDTGYRGIDLIQLTIADLKETIKTGELIVLESKTKGTRKRTFKRRVVLSSKLIETLKDFVKDKSDCSYVYPSPVGKSKFNKPITRNRLGKIFREVIIDDLGIDVKSVGVHTPRKTYGYIQYQEHDRDINYVQELFGHSSTRITKSYIGLDDDILEESAKCMNKYHF
ncbi:tyrosine-type recombinase/integrase [uncultured Clostridium sp.]|uniref:tyrosine-type recombinase/integrase n=1 Tax=uncultured Clostridium sp. TaxID=59620 RepID=UPI0026152A51|nr:tyrosine-type recombinase/integrase [uncultured Clostridium sp.]